MSHGSNAMANAVVLDTPWVHNRDPRDRLTRCQGRPSLRTAQRVVPKASAGKNIARVQTNQTNVAIADPTAARGDNNATNAAVAQTQYVHATSRDRR
jgi:hypothetical protein